MEAGRYMYKMIAARRELNVLFKILCVLNILNILI